MAISSFHSFNPAWLAVPLFFLCLWRFVGKLMHAYFLRRYTTVEELPLLGLWREKKINGTAVVCGGSISGLVTARVCSDHFTNVIIIDPELHEIERTKPSTRIAQYDSLHGYLTFVLDGLRRLWPNFDNELRNAGGFIAAGDVKPFFGGTLLPAPYEEYERKAKKLPETMYIRRPVLENLLRRLVLGSSKATSNIHTITGSVRTLDVKKTANGERVGAVVVRQPNGNEITINDPTLVTDCSGDSQAGLKWLKKAGYDIPQDLRLEYHQKLNYVTITFTVNASIKHRIDKILREGGQQEGYDHIGWLYTFVPHHHSSNEGFVLGKMDNDTMQLCCGGWGDVSLPLSAGEIEGYISLARGHEPVPEWVLDTVRILVEEGEPTFKPLKIRPCSYIRYQDVKGLPSNFVAVGDAMLQLNPIYAQGCSKAMMGAVTLNALLASCTPVPRSSKDGGKDDMPADFSKRYFREVSNHGEALWESTKAFDYGFASTRPVQGETLDWGSFGRWYLDLFIDAAFHDKELASCMWHVRMLLAPPTDMFAPRIVLRLASRTLQSRLGRWLH